MSTAKAEVLKFPTKTKLVCSACGAPGEGSCHCGAPYVTPGERAEAAVKANPEKSDRAIADEIGVSDKTVAKARRSTADNSAVEKRIGKDGKKRRQPKPRKAPKRHAKADEIAALADAGATNAEIAKKTGVSERQVRHIVEEDAIRREAEPNIDPTSLSMSARQKLDAALRQHKRTLDAEHAERTRAVDDEVRQRVLNEAKDHLHRLEEMEEKARDTEETFRRMINNHKPPFSREEYKTILMCLHPDGQRTAAKLAEAFRLFNSKKLQLSGEK